jgi:hypothetical protein
MHERRGERRGSSCGHTPSKLGFRGRKTAGKRHGYVLSWAVPCPVGKRLQTEDRLGQW